MRRMLLWVWVELLVLVLGWRGVAGISQDTSGEKSIVGLRSTGSSRRPAGGDATLGPSELWGSALGLMWVKSCWLWVGG